MNSNSKFALAGDDRVVATASLGECELAVPDEAADLRHLLEPIMPQAFFDEIWGKRFAHIVGQMGRFSALFPWSHLNTVLEHHRIDAPRLRLFHAGRQIEPGTYQHSSVLPGNGVILTASDVKRHLRAGATLVIEEIEDTFAPLRDLVIRLENIFRVNVHCNLYAGWKTDEGFAVHWDPHDTLILQLYGRKRWRVWGPTRHHPIYGETESSVAPTTEPLLDTHLEDGSVLYLPRGWWHVAQPVDEPTLHLTLSINNRTGLDLLTWMAKTLRRSELFRKDLPIMGTKQQSQAHMTGLQQDLMKAWTPDTLDRFLGDVQAKRYPRPVFRLPAFE